jgi:hypothetical protein
MGLLVTSIGYGPISTNSGSLTGFEAFRQFSVMKAALRMRVATAQNSIKIRVVEAVRWSRSLSAYDRTAKNQSR